MSTWKYLSNQFAVATENSYKKALILASDHDSRLDAAKTTDPAITPLYTRFHPIYQAYTDAYTAWTAALGLQEGGTLTVDDLLDTLSGEKARQWDIKVMSTYDKGTPQHTAIFPNARTPFQQGPIDTRIAAVKSLHTRLIPHTADLPTTLLTDVLTFHTELITARNLQQGRQGDAAQAATNLEAARLTLVEMMYGNLGLLMDHHRANPDATANYFELSLIRRKSDTPDHQDTSA